MHSVDPGKVRARFLDTINKRARIRVADRIVVTGIGIVSPLGLDVGSTWRNLLAGKSGVAQIASFDTEGLNTTIAAEVKGFEPEAYVGRKQARRMDRFVQLAAAAALQAASARSQVASSPARFSGRSANFTTTVVNPKSA